MSDLVTAWNRQREALLETGDGKIQSLAITIETSLNSPSFIKLGETVRHLLQIIAFLPQGISKTRITAIFPGVSNIEPCANALCRQSLAYLNGDFITLLAPIRLYISNRYNKDIDTSMNPFLREVRSYYAAHVEDEKIVGQDNVNIEHVLTHWLKIPETITYVLSSIADFVITLTYHWSRPVSLRPAISAVDISRPYHSVSCIQFHIGISIFRRSKAPRAKLRCLASISYLMRLMGQIKEADETYTEARVLALDTGHSFSLALMDYSLATGYFKQGNYLAAENLFQSALKNVSRASNHRQDWKTLMKITMIQLSVIKGMPNILRSHLVVLRTLKKVCRGDIANIYINAGFMELHDDHLDIAKNCFEEMQKNIGKEEPLWLMASLGLAEVADRQHDYAGSKALRSQLLELLQRVPDQTTKYCKYLAGMVELADGDLDKAGDYFRETIEDCSLFAELLYRARSHRALGEIAVVKQDMVAARNHFEATIELCKTMGLPKERLYLDYTCCIPNETFGGWKLYQEGHVMFNDVSRA
ncbi:hypothetical protein C0995_009585 [Termitomyces sp. Mi166|nr:hypothetical protein C0995_009585 [Termitomyces sp. Mi166\